MTDSKHLWHFEWFAQKKAEGYYYDSRYTDTEHPSLDWALEGCPGCVDMWDLEEWEHRSSWRHIPPQQMLLSDLDDAGRETSVAMIASALSLAERFQREACTSLSPMVSNAAAVTEVRRRAALPSNTDYVSEQDDIVLYLLWNLKDRDQRAFEQAAAYCRESHHNWFWVRKWLRWKDQWPDA